jgi:hypothetical protein
LFTHWPFLNSCQGKQPLSVAKLRCGVCACAADQIETAKQNKKPARMRAMHKTPSPSKEGQTEHHVTGAACAAKASS